MILDKKIINYKVLDLVELYNFDINFVFIQFHLEKIWIYLCYNHFLGRLNKSTILENRFSETVDLTKPPLADTHFQRRLT